MNINEAKNQIRNAMKAYFTKDNYGLFVLPPEEQRPVFLMGPPGIGKTAIMKQIADELGVNLVSYSMTHHTRQSALGLPVIVTKNYGGTDTQVSEYTMSEIIASVYDTMEDTGIKEGILFLDEINCVSETLTPAMLQFLQFKTFGKHKVPSGWIVVTAGNPPEYNRNARELDIVTWDRLKRIDVEPDFYSWKEYAVSKGIHASVISYLDAKPDNFYRIEHTPQGRSYVTARGWADLSEMIKLYEKNDIPVDMLLVGQYLRNKEITEDFSNYYELYNKYRSDYKIRDILSGKESEEICERASAAAFDERLSLISLMLDTCAGDVKDVIQQENIISLLLPVLKNIKCGTAPENAAEEFAARCRRDERRGAMTPEKLYCCEAVKDFLSKTVIRNLSFDAIKTEYDRMLVKMRDDAAHSKELLENLFRFSENVWSKGQELMVILAELTAAPHFARFISRYGCDAYYRLSEDLMFRERQLEISRRIDQLEAQYL